MSPDRLLLALLLAALSTTLNAGTIYRWTDSSGQVHFSDAAPARNEVSTRTYDESAPTAPVPGIRPGERRMLQRAEQREQRIRNSRTAARRAFHREHAERRRVCRDTEKRLAGLRSLKTGSEQRRRLLRKRRSLRCFGAR